MREVWNLGQACVSIYGPWNKFINRLIDSSLAYINLLLPLKSTTYTRGSAESDVLLVTHA